MQTLEWPGLRGTCLCYFGQRAPGKAASPRLVSAGQAHRAEARGACTLGKPRWSEGWRSKPREVPQQKARVWRTRAHSSEPREKWGKVFKGSL